ncbi:hypothetical protein HDK77DRAFT_476580 [Phyllosticta capitalensis]|uniref:uncharacterized protein n=1 Tax=Phyllosticta capitalensis TaxID=121624 RepID=UPI00312E0F13
MIGTITVDGVDIPLFRTKIADKPNLTIRLYEYENPHQANKDETDDDNEATEADDKAPKISKVTDFEVQKDILTTKSPVFSSMLGSHWREAGENTVELHEDTFISTTALEIWFRVFHDKINQDEHCKGVTRAQLWHLCEAAVKYGFRRADLKDWFGSWFDQVEGSELSEQIARELLYPCFAFGNIHAFARVTKYLAYNATGYITEVNPTPFRGLHLPSRCLQQLNYAKSGLRTSLHRKLWTPFNVIFKRASCGCKETAIYNFQKRLTDERIWPLEETLRKDSMETVLHRLQGTDCRRPIWDRNCKGPGRCGSWHWELDLHQAANDMWSKFDGLCLDCMDHSKPKTGDTDEDYWRHQEFDDEDGFYCSGFRHGRTSWFHSYMGRKSFKKARDAWENRV